MHRPTDDAGLHQRLREDAFRDQVRVDQAREDDARGAARRQPFTLSLIEERCLHVDWNSLAQFSVATFLILVTPGPIMVIIAHNTLRQGPMAGLSTVIGVELGEVCIFVAVFAGLSLSGELLPVLFRWLPLAGALYLVWLATDTIRLRNPPARRPNLPRARKPVLDGLTIAFANPAALLFYAAFFPQFIDPDHSIPKQMVLLSAIYVCICLHALGLRLCLRLHSRAHPAGQQYTGWQICELCQRRGLSLDRSHHHPQIHGDLSLIWDEDTAF